MPKVATIGEILVEVMTKQVGQHFTEAGDMVGPFASGAPAIFIDQAARMGADAGIIARVGEDDFGRLNIERLQKDGVDISQVRSTPGYTTGTAFVTYFADGERKFIFHFTHSAAGMLSPEDIDPDYLKDCQYLHVMGCSLSASDSLRQAILKGVSIVRKNGGWISFDPNIRPELLGDSQVRKAFAEILSVTDILLTGTSELIRIIAVHSIDEAISNVKQNGTSIIVLKNGSKGTKVIHGTDHIIISPIQVEEVDPTGAGDCFDGAFIASLAEGKEIREAALIANAAGALSVTKRGPMEGAAHREDIFRIVNLPNL
jgi:sugar/nucleoside kinase (ribokinase family)